MNTKYSFLISVYIKEKPEYLNLSIDSMINQTLKPDEIILVEDGPLTDELYAVIDKYQTENKDLFTIVKLEKNVGLGLALNEGIKVARNELIARMDGDDICLKNRCEEQLKMFDTDKELDIVGTMVDEFSEDPKNIISSRIVPTNNKDIVKFAKRRSPFNHPTVMYKKSKILENGGYANLRRNQDVDLFGRMIFNGCKCANVNKSLLLFRSNSNLMKRRKNWENTSLYIQVIYKFWRMGFSSFLDLAVVTCGQLIVFILPVKIQKIIYDKFLRRKNNEGKNKCNSTCI